MVVCLESLEQVLGNYKSYYKNLKKKLKNQDKSKNLKFQKNVLKDS